MNQFRAIRQQRRAARIDELCRAVERLLDQRTGLEVWLFGSWARGDWDARSDVDLIAVAPTREETEQLADDLLRCALADDVIPRTHSLERLVEDLQATGIDTGELRPLRLHVLSRMITATRYPSGDEAPSDLFDEQDARECLSMAEKWWRSRTTWQRIERVTRLAPATCAD